MRIATFNIWNKQTLWKERLNAICEVVKKINAFIKNPLLLKERISYYESINSRTIPFNW